MIRNIILISLLSVVFANDKITNDQAFKMVVQKINKNIVPNEYLIKVFSDKKITIHKKLSLIHI